MTVTRLLLEGPHPVLVYAPSQAYVPHRIVVYIHGYAIDWHQNSPPQPTAPGAALNHYVDYIDRFHHIGPQVHHAVDNGILVIIPESPKSKSDLVKWTTAKALLEYLKTTTALQLGDEKTPITVIGHSGAYRTMYYWRKETRVDDMCLIDGLYGFADEFREWVEGAPQRRLALVVGPSGTPRANSERLVARSKVKARIREPWDKIEDLSTADLEAPLLFWRTNLQHMDLVKSGKIIPQILRRAP